MEKWKCTICGYIHEGSLPEDFVCPICKAPASKFEKIEDAPDICPVCKHPQSYFEVRAENY
ncbi:MAG: hypothetical protein LUE19_04735 [Clostridiales bacterium]|nr:hypothetical protein [Clostridiales bacterium]